jgi:chromosome segregation ATPase
MTTATVEPSADLEKAIEHLDEQIGKQRAEVAEWEARERECNSLLAELRHSYIEAAGQKVMGRASPVDKLASQIETLKEQSIGFAHVIGVKREILSDLQSRLQPLHAEQTRLQRAREIAEERAAVEKVAGDAAQALNDLDAVAARFGSLLSSLRQRQYTDESSKHLAFDAAFALERRVHGQRP